MGIYIDGQCHNFDKVIVATGGVSYRMTGSTGDGFRFAKNSGHRLIEPTQGLVPLDVKEEWVKELQGLALKNVGLTLIKNKKTYYEDFGEMLFTHFGVSGPMVLTGSSYLKKANWPIDVIIDLKPKLSREQLNTRLLKDFEKYHRKNFENALGDLLPRKLIPVIIELSKISPVKKKWIRLQKKSAHDSLIYSKD